MNYNYVIALTFNEFQVLYSSSEIRLARYRLVAIPTDVAGHPNFFARSGKEVLERAPHFDVEAEHSIIVGVIDQIPPDYNHDQMSPDTIPISSDVFYLPIRSFRSFHSLTERGERILAGRLEGFEIDLKPPLFENEVIETIHEWSARRSLAGGHALVELITGDDAFRIDPRIAEQAFGALKRVHAGQQLPIEGGTFLDSLLCYERHEALPREDIGFLMDLGLVLKDSLDEKNSTDPLSSFRNWVKALNLPSSILSNLLNLPDLKEILDEIMPSSKTLIPLTLSTLFIRWKHQGLTSGAVDLALISSDVQDANKTHSPEGLKSVLWLFGLYWGIDRLVPEYYYRIPDEYEFLRQQKKVDHKPIRLAEVKTQKRKSPPSKKRTIGKGRKAAEAEAKKPIIDEVDLASKIEKPKDKQAVKTPEKGKKKPKGGDIDDKNSEGLKQANTVETDVDGTPDSKEAKNVAKLEETKADNPPEVILKGGKKNTDAKQVPPKNVLKVEPEDVFTFTAGEKKKNPESHESS